MFDLICSRNIYHESQSPWIAVLTVTNPNQPTCKYTLIPQKLQRALYMNSFSNLLQVCYQYSMANYAFYGTSNKRILRNAELPRSSAKTSTSDWPFLFEP